MFTDVDKFADDILKKVVGTSGPNTSVIAPGETPRLPANQSDVLAGADKSVDDISKKAAGTSGPNTSVIAPGETPPLPGKKALEKPSSAMSKQHEKKIAENRTSKMPTRKRSERNTKKNPWTMTNPNYKFGDIILRDDDLNVVAPCTRDLHTFFMQCSKAEDNSLIMIALRPGTSWWPKREESSNGPEQIPMRLNYFYDLFKLDALDVTLIHCFIM
jgi:hypothetical protein